MQFLDHTANLCAELTGLTITIACMCLCAESVKTDITVRQLSCITSLPRKRRIGKTPGSDMTKYFRKVAEAEPTQSASLNHGNFIIDPLKKVNNFMINNRLNNLSIFLLF